MREHMSIEDRAKQFMPFSALKGYEEAVAAKEIIKHERIIPAEDAQAELDSKLRALRIGDSPEILFYEDEDYVHISGRLHKIDLINRRLLIGSKEIPIDDIYDIK